MACTNCRRRKMRCDMTKPCSTCRRLQTQCEYEVAQRRGPKRRNVRDLEARLALVESHLTNGNDNVDIDNLILSNEEITNPAISWETPDGNGLQIHPDLDSNIWSMDEATLDLSLQNLDSDIGGFEFTPPGSWELFDLGRCERLPQQDLIDRLTELYFEKIHPHIPLIHRVRYLADLHLAPQAQPPLCLRYMIWALAATQCSEHSSHAGIFYKRARQYLESDELEEPAISMSVGHVQCWCLISLYETYIMSLTRAWMSDRRSVALAQMLCFHSLDSVKGRTREQRLHFRDEIEIEQGRRAFWATFCSDRWASVGTGLPTSINMQDIFTNLPCSEEAFHRGEQAPTQTLVDALENGLLPNASPFAATVVVACVMGQIMNHCNNVKDIEANSTSSHDNLVRDHKHLDGIITKTFISLPEHLRFKTARQGPIVAFLNMCLHAASICLHLAEIDRSSHVVLDVDITSASHRRCRNAAQEILLIMQLVAHIDPAQMDPFTAFGLYMTSTVIIRQHAKSDNRDEDKENLRLIINAMQSLQKHWKMTNSFIMQLNSDLKRHDIDIFVPERRGDINLPIDDEAFISQIKTGPLLTGVLQQSRGI